MSPIGSVTSLLNSALLNRTEGPVAKPAVSLPGDIGSATPSTETQKSGFSSMLDGIVSTVDSKSATAQAQTQKVLLGQSDQLHQSVIAMQEAGVAFSLMVEVRNKLVESYQELMRMQA